MRLCTPQFFRLLSLKSRESSFSNLPNKSENTRDSKTQEENSFSPENLSRYFGIKLDVIIVLLYMKVCN